ncbi:hypothetical protein FZC84_14185 [Rossellomorea vietnamensis]|uniref:Uncharacterized protein n=1 Tax=Rossellomorea vietnamensis TaxID=218284 RepID=A0A5D4MAB8_9BACI|nr:MULTISPECIES: hypothetical protein [Bacillaceae]TYR98576.1 hypothetical protein FZC84_14185 [Rossellomorea vietnamensis]
MAKKMKRKSKKKQNWGLTKDERQEIASSWVREYEGDNIVKAYSKKFRLNLKSSLKELTSFGFTISSEERAQIKRLIDIQKQQRENKKRKKEARELQDLIDSDETFAFIAGYTEGGAPFGITHEEMQENEEN